MDEMLILPGLLIVGFAMKLSGFVVRDELWLRGLVAGGLGCDALFYGLRSDPILLSVGANVTLVTINLVLVGIILIERTTWRMTAADRALYAFFPTLSPGQFRRVRRMIVTERVPPETRLTTEGAPVDALMLVIADRIEIAKGGTGFPISGPSFVGEIAFLTGRPSSADVTLREGGVVHRIDSAALKARMARSLPLQNAMVALFGQELARKVADSVPMARAADRQATPQPARLPGGL